MCLFIKLIDWNKLVINLGLYYNYFSCADPESFVRGGPTLTTFLVVEGREDQNNTKSGVSMAGRWWHNIEC